MRKSTIILFQISVGMMFIGIVPGVFAASVQVDIPPGTSVPGCEETNECYIPFEAKPGVSGEVVWTNSDSAILRAMSVATSDVIKPFSGGTGALMLPSIE